MDAGNGREARGRTLAALAACLMASALAISCTVYKIRDLDGKALAAKPPKGRIISVSTAAGRVDFRENDPGQMKDKAIIGNVYGTLTLDPLDIADVTSLGPRAAVVAKDGSRFQVLASRRSADGIECDVVRPKRIPIDEVVTAKVRSVNAAATLLSTLGGAVLLAGVVALDLAIHDDEEDLDPDTTFTGGMISSAIDCLIDPHGGWKPLPRTLDALSGLKGGTRTAEEKDFWVLEWTPVGAAPGENGRYRVGLGNTTGIVRGVDEAKLVVIDHAPGLVIAPDVRGSVRACSALVPPVLASETDGRDITGFVRDKDDVFWRSPGGDSAADIRARPREEISLEFPRPKGASRAKLVVNATNSAWPVQFAREAEASQAGEERSGEAKPVYQEWEYSKLRIGLLTAFGWQTGQVVFAGGPLPAEDMIYNIDLDDVDADLIRIKLEPPAGYWLIDRLALDFSEDIAVEAQALDAEGADGPDAAEVLRALAVEDGSTVLLEGPESMTMLTFLAPPQKDGMERSVFLRTVSRYEMPPRAGATPPRRPGLQAR